MKVHKELGGTLSATLSARGATIIEQSGVIWDASYHGTDLPMGDYALTRAEKAAREVLDAIQSYRDATAGAPDPVITWERPSYHKQAGTMPKATLAALNGDDPEAA